MLETVVASGFGLGPRVTKTKGQKKPLLETVAQESDPPVTTEYTPLPEYIELARKLAQLTTRVMVWESSPPVDPKHASFIAALETAVRARILDSIEAAAQEVGASVFWDDLDTEDTTGLHALEETYQNVLASRTALTAVDATEAMTYTTVQLPETVAASMQSNA